MNLTVFGSRRDIVRRMRLPLDRWYDLLNTALFASAGGSGRVRQQLVDALAPQPSSRVLELGCGTGQVTARLVRTGAEVVAVDAVQGMLAGARRRAPAAILIEGDVFDVDVDGHFDAVVLSFLLHNMPGSRRRELLSRCRTLLRSGGQVAILEWDEPGSPLRAAVWRRLLARIEPSPSVPEILTGALQADCAAAGLRVSSRQVLVGGRVQLLLSGAAGS